MKKVYYLIGIIAILAVIILATSNLENDQKIVDVLDDEGWIDNSPIPTKEELDKNVDDLVDRLRNDSQIKHMLKPSPYPFPGPSEYSSCELDSECISVRAGCCGCSSGGVNTAINKKYAEEYDEKIMKDYNCSGPAGMCRQMYICPENVVPKCVQNVCSLVAE